VGLPEEVLRGIRGDILDEERVELLEPFEIQVHPAVGLRRSRNAEAAADVVSELEVLALGVTQVLLHEGIDRAHLLEPGEVDRALCLEVLDRNDVALPAVEAPYARAGLARDPHGAKEQELALRARVLGARLALDEAGRVAGLALVAPEAQMGAQNEAEDSRRPVHRHPV